MRVHPSAWAARIDKQWPLALAAVVLEHCALAARAESESTSGYASWPTWLLVLVCTTTVVLSAMYCGLTIGLLGMETIYLEIIADAGQEPDRTFARKILPVRMLGHQLLATLLVGNMLTLVLTSQLVAAIVNSSDLVNFILGTLVVLIFGEIIPMSFCNNQDNALWAGTKSLPALKVSLFVLWPIAKPLGLMLDCMVGHDAGQMYDRKELKKLIRLHCEKFSDKSGIDTDQVRMMLSALDMNEVTVDAAMTPMEKAVMLEASTPLDTALERRLWQYGISRVPVYYETPDRIIGVLYVKDLIHMSYLGRNTDMTVRDFVVQHPRDMLVVKADTLLQEMLHIFEHRHTQLIFVEPVDAPPREGPQAGSRLSTPWQLRDTPLDPGGVPPVGHFNAAADATPSDDAGGSPHGPGTGRRSSRFCSSGHQTPVALVTDTMERRSYVGIVTLEDVIEELIASEIYDEDEYSGDEVNMSDGEVLESIVEPPPTRPPRVNFYAYGVPPKSEDQSLSEDQLWALAYYLTRAYVYFATWNVAYVKFLLQQVGDVIVHVDDFNGDGEDQNNSTSASAIAASLLNLNTVDPTRVLYRAGQPSAAFTLVLSGGVEVSIGREKLHTELRSFSDLADEVLLSDEPFIPDYTAVVSRTSRLIRITQADVRMAEKKLNDYRSRRNQKPLRLTPPVVPAVVPVAPPSTVTTPRKKSSMRAEDKRVTFE